MLLFTELPFQVGEQKSAEDDLLGYACAQGKREHLQVECLRISALDQIRQAGEQPEEQKHGTTSQRIQKSAEEQAFQLRLEPFLMDIQRKAAQQDHRKALIIARIRDAQYAADDPCQDTGRQRDNEKAPEDQEYDAQDDMFVEKFVLLRCWGLCVQND